MSNVMTTDERYTTATHSSSLRVEADKRGDADVIIAAGWSPSRLGAALLRLRGEYDCIQHPRRMTQQAINVYAETLVGTPAQKTAKAQQTAINWHIHEMSLMLGRLKTMPTVRGNLILKARMLGIDDPQDVAVSVMMWWLDSVCKVCSGQRYELIQGTPSTSGRACKHCQGSGEEPLPYGRAGQVMQDYIRECLGQARQSIKRRLRP